MPRSFAQELSSVSKVRNLAVSLERAFDYARQGSHRTVTLEHLLLALSEDDEAIGVLRACGIDLDKLRVDIAGSLGRHTDYGDGKSEPTADPKLMKVLQIATAAMQRSGRAPINSAIVLAAIVGEGQSGAAEVLMSQGLTFDSAIKALQGTAQTASQKVAQAAQPATGGGKLASAQPAAKAATGGKVVSRASQAADAQIQSTDQILASVRERINLKRGGTQPPAEVAAEPAPASLARASYDDTNDDHDHRDDVMHQPVADEPPTGPVVAPYVPSIWPDQPQHGQEQNDPPASQTDWQDDNVIAPWPETRDPARQPPPERHPLDYTPQSYQPPYQSAGSLAGAPYPAADEMPVQQPAARQPMPPPAMQQRAPYPQQPYQSAPAQNRRNAARTKPPAVVRLGELIENIPRFMRVGISETVEVRIARDKVEGLPEGMQGRGAPQRHDLFVTRAMCVKLKAPGGGFWIETASPETQWIENTLGLLHDEFASWRWTVTPQRRGAARLQLVISARTIGTDGLAAETPLPEQVFHVKVRTNYGKSMKQLAGWGLAAVGGGALHAIGSHVFGVNAIKAVASLFGL